MHKGQFHTMEGKKREKKVHTYEQFLFRKTDQQAPNQD